MVTPSDTPPCTKPTSTVNAGSASRLRFSSEPREESISSLTPLRASILR